MTDIQPFSGLRYNPELVPDLSSAIAPPYDIITPEQQVAYHQNIPNNIIRLEYSMDSPNDNETSNKYTRAAQTLHQWIQQGILIREEKPAYYIVEHRFRYNNDVKSFWGLVAAVLLEEFPSRNIRPTEVTMDNPVKDRLNLLRSCQANISPTMGIFDRTAGETTVQISTLCKGTPDASATDAAGSTFNVWVITDESTVSNLTALLVDSVIIIADGHHRYRTALAYHKEQIAAGQTDDLNTAHSRVMMTLIEARDKGLTVLPTHRIVRGLAKETLSALKEKLSNLFDIKELPAASADFSETLKSWLESVKTAGEGGVAFGIYGLEPNTFCLLTHSNKSQLADKLSHEMPESWRSLDVSIVQQLIFQPLLKIDSKEKETNCLEYTHDAPATLQMVSEGEAQLAFLMNPIPVSSIIAIADDGVTMPPKSTYFHPKTPAGLVINPLF